MFTMTARNHLPRGGFRFALFAALALLALDLQAGLLNGSESAAPSSSSGESKTQDPYAPIVERIRKMNQNAISPADAAYLSNMASSIDSVAAASNLRLSALAAYACLGKFDEYRAIRRTVSDPEAFEKDVLDSCPKCSGKGTENSPSGGKARCRTCKGVGWKIKNRELAKRRLGLYLERSDLTLTRLQNKWVAEREEAERIEEEKRKKEEEERLKKQREDEMRLQREKEEKERLARREEQRRRDEEFARQQRAKGLVFYDGEWMTPSERDLAQKRDRFFRFIEDRSLNNCVYSILQIIGDGKALCTNRRNGNTFCLLYSTDSANNRAISEGDVLRNNLWWCGTYKYTTVRNAMSTVPMFAIDVEVAIREAIRQGYLED